MSDSDVQRQIKHMIAFIDQEANEKAEEIDAKADEEYNIEKARLVNVERAKIDEEFNAKQEQNELIRKLHRSQVSNSARLFLLNSKGQQMQILVLQAAKTLQRLAKDENHYRQILIGLVTQGICQLMEGLIVIRCREKDVTLVTAIIPECIENFKKLTDGKKQVELVIDQNSYLHKISGGVVMTSKDGRITVKNTLESRLELLSEQLLPELREILFGPNKNRRFRD